MKGILKMKLRKSTMLLLTVVMLMSVLTGCGSKEAVENEITTVNLYAYGSDNVRVTWEAVIAAFEAKNADVKVELQFMDGGMGGQSGIDKLIAAIKAGEKTVDIDILDGGDNDLMRIINEAGIENIHKLSVDNIPNMKNINPRSVIGGDHSMVFRGSTVLLAYNSDKVQNPPQTADELYQWIKENPGRFSYNDPTTGGSGRSFLVTAVYNLLPEEALTSNDPKWKNEWEKGFALLKELHPFMYHTSGKVVYLAKNQGTINLLADGEVDMIPAWADMILDQKAQGLLPESIKLTQIKPGFTGGVQSLFIPELSQRKEASYKVLDFVASPEGQQIFLDVQKAIPVIDTALLKGELEGLDIKGYRTFTIGDLANDLKKLWQEQIATLN